MELWIRVQKNKQLNQGLVKVENLILEKYSATEWSIGQSCDTLAIYKTKERALEVLDEIEERIMLINTINIAKDTDSLIACKNALTEEKIKGLNYPYQMPEK